MDSTENLILRCVDHSLPFRILFEEHRARRSPDLFKATVAYLPQAASATDPDQAWALLSAATDRAHQAYNELKDLKEELSRMDPSRGRTPLQAKQDEILAKEKECKRLDAPLRQILHAMDCSAVCLSGGGIRSASFSLGVLQGLARFSMGKLAGVQSAPPAGKSDPQPVADRKSLMHSLDYLSTVSGGGYIGSWLMGWATRVGYANVVQQLSSPAPTSGDPEPQPIRHLREYTSYLAPHYGLTVDSLTLVSIVLRNIFLNWLILVPAMVALFCLPYMLAEFSYWLPQSLRGHEILYFVLTMGLACVGIGIAAVVAAYNMAFPTMAREAASEDPLAQAKAGQKVKKPAEPWSVKLFVVPLLIAAWLVGEMWLLNQALATPAGGPAGSRFYVFGWLWLLSTLPPLAISIYRARRAFRGGSLFTRLDWKPTQPAWKKTDWLRLLSSFVAPFISGVIAAVLLFGAGEIFSHMLLETDVPPDTIRYLSVLAIVPTVLIVLMIASALLSGFLSNIEREEEREWWSRAGGVLIAFTFGWVGLCAIAYFGAAVLDGTLAAALSAIGFSAGYLGSASGLSVATSSGLKKLKKEQLTQAQQFLSKHNWIAPAACLIALFCLSILLAGLTHWLLVTADAYAIPQRTLVVFGGAAALALVANRFIMVNTFSLHGMYRMRLTRAYLGASNLARHPNPFTNFDPQDNLREADLPHDGTAPLHVVNTALNLVATRNLAWQQRKAEPFSFSPLHCGCWRIGYVPTSQYGGVHGVRLGTAMAISGAAFNPNMGYNSSALVSLLMTFFNARLGWWLPNPVWPLLDMERMKAEKGPVTRVKDRLAKTKENESDAVYKAQHDAAARFLRRSGPTWALIPLLNEALGRTNDTSRFIELSDGGHFENLGLYEMVLRRCHSIILVDADADSDYEFEDLGNAIRKIYIDLGIPITFPGFAAGMPMKRDIKPENLYCARGVIDYACVDPGAPQGELIYIKPVLRGNEPEDIRSYAATHKPFPHESTVNQFFNESQFESYRHLGSWAVETIAAAHADPTDTGMKAFLDLARNYSHMPPKFHANLT